MKVFGKVKKICQNKLEKNQENQEIYFKNRTFGQLFHLKKKTGKYAGGRFFPHEQNKKRKVLNPRKGTKEGTVEWS